MKKVRILLLSFVSLLSVNSFADSYLKVNRDVVFYPSQGTATDLEISDWSHFDRSYYLYQDSVFQVGKHSSFNPSDFKKPALHVMISAINNGENEWPEKVIIKAGEYKINFRESFGSAKVGAKTADIVNQAFYLEGSPVQVLKADGTAWNNEWVNLKFNALNYNVPLARTSGPADIQDVVNDVFSHDKVMEFINK